MKYEIGVDEVGRGALAGPVVVAAVKIPKKIKLDFDVPLRDSKKLSLKQREEWFEFIKNKGIDFKVSRVSPSVIDRINISGAANKAAKLVVNRLGVKDCEVILDGGIKVLDYKSLPKADENFRSVALASIVAKVIRDRYMKKLAKKYPEYGFDRHVGYGTLIHREALKKNGVLDIHRRSFLKFL